MVGVIGRERDREQTAARRSVLDPAADVEERIREHVAVVDDDADRPLVFDYEQEPAVRRPRRILNVLRAVEIADQLQRPRARILRGGGTRRRGDRYQAQQQRSRQATDRTSSHRASPHGPQRTAPIDPEDGSQRMEEAGPTQAPADRP